VSRGNQSEELSAHVAVDPRTPPTTARNAHGRPLNSVSRMLDRDRRGKKSLAASESRTPRHAFPNCTRKGPMATPNFSSRRELDGAFHSRRRLARHPSARRRATTARKRKFPRRARDRADEIASAGASFRASFRARFNIDLPQNFRCRCVPRTEFRERKRGPEGRGYLCPRPQFAISPRQLVETLPAPAGGRGSLDFPCRARHWPSSPHPPTRIDS